MSSKRLLRIQNTILDELLRIFSYDDSPAIYLPKHLKDELQQLRFSDEELEAKMKNTASLLQRIHPNRRLKFAFQSEVQQPASKEKLLVNI